MERQKRQPDDRRKHVDARTAYRALCELFGVLGPLKWVLGIAITVWTAFIVIPSPLNKFTRIESQNIVQDERLETLEARQFITDAYIASECLDTTKVGNLVRAQVPCYRLLRERGLIGP